MTFQENNSSVRRYLSMVENETKIIIDPLEYTWDQIFILDS